MTIGKLKFEVSEDIKALFPEEKLSSLIEAFVRLDSNEDGKIELEEYLNFALAKEKARLIDKFVAADTDQDGCVEFEEFVAVLEPNFHILKRFQELDLDRNGLLSLEEAINIADQLVLPLNTTQIEAILRKIDRDGDGQITYYEYLGAIAHIGFQ
ncbi:EF-hand domain-containing protein [Egbenema bharatensis]|uniref:EF-hand domain-containing protein n=1 Tax=Egbenema bharatensis TaxID=3463334 RepID=UPI003A848B07